MQEEELTLLTLQLVAADVASLFTAFHTQLGWAVAQGDSSSGSSSAGTLFADADQTAVAECLADFKQFYSRYIHALFTLYTFMHKLTEFMQ
jgi:hypothetical protein